MARTTIRTEDITASEVTTAKMAVDPTNASNLSSGSVPAAQLGNAPEYDDSGLQSDIALIGFKVAANGSLAKYDLVDQAIDAFEDSSGVDASASTNEARNSSGNYYSGAVAGNYFGDSSDGSVTTSGNVTFTVANKVGSYDGDMVVKQYSSLTVASGHTMTIDQSARGLFIYVAGDLTVNGIIEMSRRGGHSDPTTSGGSDSNAVGASGLQLGLKTTGGSSSFTNDGTGFNGAGTAVRTAIAASGNISSDGTIFAVARGGGSGGGDGTTGAAVISTGGGGGGGGGTGGAFSGGAGAAGVYNAPGRPGAPYGGAGGNATGGSGLNGGAGNPAGSGYGGGNAGQEGVGGIVWLVVKGNVTIGASGKILAQGGGAGSDWATGTGGNGGGGSGGGAIQILHGGTYSNSGTVNADGGLGVASFGGGPAGDGGINVAQVIADEYNNMTLVSNATTAQSAPTKGDLVMTYTNGAGTNTIGTDITAEFSADNGSTWTDFGISASDAQGTTGGHTIVTKHDVALTSTSGTSMRYRIKTLNQSISKYANIQAVSLGWS